MSGLPIREDDECYMLEFDDIGLIAYTCVESCEDYLRHLKSIKFGKYNACGDLKTPEKQNYKHAPDGRCFILKYFWDFASTDKKAAPLIRKRIQEYKRRVDNIDKLSKTVEDLDFETYVPGITIYRQDIQMFKGFIAVLYMMPGLRRNFYTAGYRGAQSTQHAWKTMLNMSKEVQSYIISSKMATSPRKQP